MRRDAALCRAAAFGANIVLDLNTFIFACFLIVVGTQLLSFGGVSRYYATVAGLLPASARAQFLLRHVTTDRLVLMALAFTLIGLGLFSYAVSAWAARDFGPLPGPIIPRTVVTGMSFLVIGLQTFFSAFLLGILSIPIRR